ncbi:MAG: 4-phosphoerythronate dehydrogenase [Bacteroidota bacterium]
MITIIADNKIPFLKGALEPYASIIYMDGHKIDSASVENADALLIRTRTICNETLLRGSRVKFIASATIGFDHIDTDYCDASSIFWTNAPGCNAASVQQYIASILAILVVSHDISLYGKTLGIIGVGHVGKKVEALARLLEMKVLLNDPPRARNEGNSGFVSLERLITESDIITLHVPLNSIGEDKTIHLINEATLRLMKKGSWLINSSRGEVVDIGALKSALSEGRLSGTAFDVWENEPVIDPQLLEYVTFATPHIAGYSTDGKRNGTVQIVRSLGAHFGLPLTEWEPSWIPEPSDPLIMLDCPNHPLENLVCQAILHTYNVTDDDFRFRSNPGDFEMQRDNYPVRREFPAYNMILKNGSDFQKEIFEKLGFNIIKMEPPKLP